MNDLQVVKSQAYETLWEVRSVGDGTYEVLAYAPDCDAAYRVRDALVIAASVRYRIVRFHRQSSSRRVLKRGLTRVEASHHCSDPATRKDGKWFDGFEVDSVQVGDIVFTR